MGIFNREHDEILRALEVVEIQNRRILRMLEVIVTKETNLMSVIDDLNNGITSLATGFGALDAAVQNELAALVAAQAANNAPAIAQAVANISQITGKMATDAQALTASIPGATTVAPPPVLPVPVPVPPTVAVPVIATPAVTDPNATAPALNTAAVTK
jgi:hypothetical protein